MNRQIKFRGKRKDNGEWVTGSLVDKDYILQYIDLAESWTPLTSDHKITCRAYAIDPATVGQFTGLKDKNGVEIYEGDLIKHLRNSRPYSSKAKTAFVECLVEWVDGSSEAENKSNPSCFNRNPGFHAYPVDRNAKGADWGHDWSEFHNCEIVGNIHELNPAKGAVNYNMTDPNVKTEATETEQEQVPGTEGEQESAEEGAEG